MGVALQAWLPTLVAQSLRHVTDKRLDVASPPESINILRQSVLIMVLEGLFIGDGIFNLKDGTFCRGSIKQQVITQ